jgi:hypothetical protein
MISDPVCEGVSDSESGMPVNVITAYRLGHYSFQVDVDPIDFSIGRFCPGIAKLFKKLCRQTAVCITAYNPLGAELSGPENEAASEELRNALMEQGWPFFSAVGKGSDGRWGPEPGYVAFGPTVVRPSDWVAVFARMPSCGLVQTLFPNLCCCGNGVRV